MVAANLAVDAGALLFRRPRGWIAHQIADEVQADVVLVGARGLGGAKAVLGSVSDMVVHTSERPVIVVPHPMLAAEYSALADGPVVVGWDGSAGAQTAFATTTRLFPDRDVVLVSVDERDGDVPSGPPEAGGRRPRSHPCQCRPRSWFPRSWSR
jgi:hypothetical protein